MRQLKDTSSFEERKERVCRRKSTIEGRVYLKQSESQVRHLAERLATAGQVLTPIIVSTTLLTSKGDSLLSVRLQYKTYAEAKILILRVSLGREIARRPAVSLHARQSENRTPASRETARPSDVSLHASQVVKLHARQS